MCVWCVCAHVFICLYMCLHVCMYVYVCVYMHVCEKKKRINDGLVESFFTTDETQVKNVIWVQSEVWDEGWGGGGGKGVMNEGC